MRIGISAGDPAGIGLEVTLRSIPSLLSEATWILYAPRSDFDANFKRFGGSLKWAPYAPRMPEAPGTLRVAFVEESGPSTETGVASPATGQRALSALSAASRAALDGEIDGLVTAPLSKQWVGRKLPWPHGLSRRSGRCSNAGDVVLHTHLQSRFGDYPRLTSRVDRLSFD